MRQPVNSTYDTKQIPFVRDLNSRGSSTNKDEYFINVYPASIKDKLTGDKQLPLVKRSGTTQFIAGVGTTNRGIFHWKETSKLFVCIDRDCYVYSSLTGTLITTLVNIVGVGTTPVGFCTFLYDTNETKVVITDGTTLSTIDGSNVVVVGADPDMPVPHLPTPFFYDGYLLLVKSNTADCYNSNLNDPLSYEPADFISAEMRADYVTAIVTMNNYFILLGNRSIEYFWDAGNATGSPFQRNDTPVKLSGYVGGISQFGNKVYLIAEEVEGQPNVFVLEDFKLTPVGNEAIRRHLASVSTQNITGNVISIDVNDMYTINTGADTYFMLIESKLWGKLAYAQQSYFPMNQAFTINNGLPTTTLFTLTNSTAVYKFSSSLYQDNGTTFTCTIVTDIVRFDNNNQKLMGSLSVHADRPTSTALLNISWSDDDYQTYKAVRTMDLNHERTNIQQLGRFRNRAFKFTFTENQPFRLHNIDCDINMGTT